MGGRVLRHLTRASSSGEPGSFRNRVRWEDSDQELGAPFQS